MSIEPPHFLYKTWLFKQSRHIKVWRHRFCVLTQSHFSTFENENINNVPTEKLLLKNCHSVQSAESELKHEFSFKIDAVKGSFFFYASSEEERDRWVGLLSSVIRQTNNFIKK